MKKLKLGLLPKILIAIALGIVCSLFFPDWASRVFVTFNSIFSNFLGVFIPLLIIGLVAPGIADLGKGAGKLLLITVAIAYFSTVVTGFFSLAVCDLSFPKILANTAGSLANFDEAYSLAPYFTIEMPAFINVTTALVVAFMLGLSLGVVKGNTLRDALSDFRDLVFLVIEKVIIPLLPIYIFGIFLKMGAEGTVGPVLSTFLKIIVVIIIMHITVLVVQFLIAGAISHKNPFKALWTMMPAYITALGTSSSAATIPVTLKQAKKNGVDEGVADFVIPLCATVHMPCSMLKITACAYAIMMMVGQPIETDVFIELIMMLAITMVAAPGVPGGAIMAAIGLLQSMLGFDANMQGLIIAIYIAIDSFGTAGNVTGDGAIALIIDRIHSRRAIPAGAAEE